MREVRLGSTGTRCTRGGTSEPLAAFLQREAGLACRRRPHVFVALRHPNFHLENDMGKYIFAWILGVPAIVLVGIYLVAHL